MMPTNYIIFLVILSQTQLTHKPKAGVYHSQSQYAQLTIELTLTNSFHFDYKTHMYDYETTGTYEVRNDTLILHEEIKRQLKPVESNEKISPNNREEALQILTLAMERKIGQSCFDKNGELKFLIKGRSIRWIDKGNWSLKRKPEP